MNRDEAINHTRYQMALWTRERKLFARLQRAIQAIQLMSGLASIASITSAAPEWTATATGAVIATSVVIDFVFRPADAAARAQNNLLHWSRMHTATHTLPEAELAKTIHESWERPDDTQGALRNLAYNDMLDERGYPNGHIALSLWQKALRAIS